MNLSEICLENREGIGSTCIKFPHVREYMLKVRLGITISWQVSESSGACLKANIADVERSYENPNFPFNGGDGRIKL